VANGPSEEQLNVAKSLAPLMKSMADSAAAMERSQSSQVQSVKQLATAFSSIQAGELVTSLNEVTKSLKDLIERLGNVGTTAQRTLGDMTQQAAKAETNVKALGESASKAADAVDELNQSRMQELIEELKQSRDFADFAKKSVESFGEYLQKKFPKSAIIATFAFSGLIQSFKNMYAMSKSILGFFKTLVGGLFDVASAVISIPFKLFGSLFDMAEKSGGGTNEWAEAVNELKKQYGDLAQTTPSVILKAAKSMDNFSQTGLNLNSILGNSADRLKQLTELSVEMGPVFDKFTSEFENNSGAILAFQKGLGLSNEDMRVLGQTAVSEGTKFGGQFLEMQKQVDALSSSTGIASKTIARAMAKAVADVKHFGGATKKEIGAAVVYAHKLGTELEKMVGVLDAFETFEGAAENASKLSQAFGVQVDAFKMMQAQDPATQIEMLRKQFAMAGRDASSFNRQQLKLLASSTGLSEETAKQVFSLKNQGMSLDEVKKKAEKAEKKQLTQAQAMEKLANAIEKMMKGGGGGDEGSFFARFSKGVLGAITKGEEFRKIMTNIREMFKIVKEEGKRFGQTLANLPGVKQFLGGIADILNPERFRKLVRGITDELIALAKGDKSFPEVMEEIKKKFFNFFDAAAPAGKKMLEGFKRIIKGITGMIAEAIKWMTDQLKDGLIFLTDLIAGRKKLGIEIGGSGFLGDIIEPLIESFSYMGEQLAPVLLELVKTIGSKLGSFIKSELLPALEPYAPMIAMVLFGPLFAKTVLGAIVAAIGQKAMKNLTGEGKQEQQAQKAAEDASKKQADAAVEQVKAANKQFEAGTDQFVNAKKLEEVMKSFGGFVKEFSADVTRLVKVINEQKNKKETASENLISAVDKMVKALQEMKKSLEQFTEAANKLSSSISNMPKSVGGGEPAGTPAGAPAGGGAEQKPGFFKKMKDKVSDALGMVGKLALLAAALAGGGILFAYAFKGISEIVKDITIEDAVKAGAVIFAAVQAISSLSESAGKTKGETFGSLGQTLSALGLALTVGGITFAIAFLIISGIVGRMSLGTATVTGLVLAAMVTAMGSMADGLEKIKDMENLNWKKVTSVLLGLSLALSGGFMVFAAAFWAMSMLVEKIELGAMVKTAAILGLFAVIIPIIGLTAKATEKLGKGGAQMIGYLAIGIAVISLMALALAVVASLSLEIIGEIKPDQAIAAGKLLESMAKVFLMMVPVAFAAAALGAAMIVSFGIMGFLIAKGMDTLNDLVTKVTTTVKNVVVELNNMPNNAGIGQKIDAFVKVLDAVTKFTGLITDFIKVLLPDMDDLEDEAEPFTRVINSVIGLLKEMMGSDKKGERSGLIGLIDLIKDTLTTLSSGAYKNIGESASAVSGILDSIGAIAKSMTPSDEFIKIMKDFARQTTSYNKGVREAGEKGRADFMSSVKDYAGIIGGFAEKLLPELQKTITALASAPIPSPARAKAVGEIINSVAGLLKSIMPDPDTLKLFVDSLKEYDDDPDELEKEVLKFDATAWSTFFTTLTTEMGKIFDAIAGTNEKKGFIEMIAKSVEGIDAEKLPKLNVFSQIFAATGEFINGLMPIISMSFEQQKEINKLEEEIAKVRAGSPAGAVGDPITGGMSILGKFLTDKEKPAEQNAEITELQRRIKEQKSGIPKISDLITDIASALPALIDAFMVPMAGFPQVSGMEEQLAKIKTMFELFQMIPSLVGSIIEMQKKFYGGGEDANQSLGPMDAKSFADVMVTAITGLAVFFERIFTQDETLLRIFDSLKRFDSMFSEADYVRLKGTKVVFELLKSAMTAASDMGRLSQMNDEGKVAFDPQAVLTSFGAITEVLNGIVNAPDLAVNLSDVQSSVRESPFEMLLNSLDLMGIDKLTKVNEKLKLLNDGLSEMKRMGESITPNLGSLGAFFKGLPDLFSNLTNYSFGGSVNFESTLKTIDQLLNLHEFVDRINTMNAVMGIDLLVDKIDELNNKLKSMPKIKLDALMTPVKGGMKNTVITHKVTHENIMFHINLNVQMGAKQMEQAILLRPDSVIRDRLNYSTTNPDAKLPEEIGTSRLPVVPPGGSKPGTA
jgi:ABC-type transporter Mla subunit MlaD